jgi:hypothetical protein
MHPNILFCSPEQSSETKDIMSLNSARVAIVNPNPDDGLEEFEALFNERSQWNFIIMKKVYC